MTPARLLPILLALIVAGCSTTQTAKTSSHTKGKHLTVRTTAYTHTEAGGIKNAIGSRLRYGTGEYSAASDWSWLPLGTRFRMVENGRIYVIEDYGSALVGRKTIDLYVPSMREVRRWGVRHQEIEILEMGSKAMSLKLLAPRARNRHVAVMVAQLRRDGVVPPG
jgi:3D (Asp-Asp-Asp) domain-containing protein